MEGNLRLVRQVLSLVVVVVLPFFSSSVCLFLQLRSTIGNNDIFKGKFKGITEIGEWKSQSNNMVKKNQINSRHVLEDTSTPFRSLSVRLRRLCWVQMIGAVRRLCR